MTRYDFDYAFQRLRDRNDFAEIEHDFVPLRKWANEVEQSGHEMEAFEARLNDMAQQDFLLMNRQSVAKGGLSPEEAGRCIRLWLNHGQRQDLVAQLTYQVQPA